MLGRIFGILCLISLIFGMLEGRIDAVATAIPDGAASALSVTLSLCGMMCLWCGVMEVLREAGFVRRLSRLCTPILRLFFPRAYKSGVGSDEISASIAANLLGIGNAATPLALAAMEKLHASAPAPDTASGEEITLAVLNTASLTLIPANLTALRRAAGSSDPFTIMLPVWVVSCLSSLLALLLTAIPRKIDAMRQNTHHVHQKTP